MINPVITPKLIIQLQQLQTERQIYSYNYYGDQIFDKNDAAGELRKDIINNNHN